MKHSVQSDAHLGLTAEYYARARRIIPGGTQLVSKRPEMFAPGKWPAYYRRASGCEVTDLDGKTYIDMSLMGVGACLLGFADPAVCEAVNRRVRDGSMCTLNSPEEVDLAEQLIAIHPWAGAVRFARTGGESMAMAVRIARAKTGRDLIVFCGYHGWQDWYLAANRTADGPDNLREHLLPGLSPAGVPAGLAGTTLPFRYNHAEELEDVLRRNTDRIAAVVMEPTRSIAPAAGFLERVRELCQSAGVLLVFDEITAGWRLHFGGAHLRYGVEPDMAVFAKALGNGHPIAAVMGVEKTMQAAQDSFISSTAWTEGVGPAAALATLARLRELDAPMHVSQIGEQFRTGLADLARRTSVPLVLQGPSALTSLRFENVDALALQTLLTVRMLDRRFLSGSAFYPSCAHRAEHVSAFLSAAGEVFVELREAIEAGDAMRRVDGAVKHSGFARLT
jgi:glutamate-1-semialdehyde 2,1-aminomutase